MLHVKHVKKLNVPKFYDCLHHVQASSDWYHHVVQHISDHFVLLESNCYLKRISSLFLEDWTVLRVKLAVAAVASHAEDGCIELVLCDNCVELCEISFDNCFE